ncbi:MAG: family N-acetyltransferase [Nocardioides sp.]|nr:family N-acetyltransferase [Nocardioides sp.]
MLDAAALLTAYDAQLRGAAELPSAEKLDRHGPLVWGLFAGGRGFVTYHDLGGATGDELRELVRATAQHYQDDPEVTQVEWKTRGHDHAPGLHELLVEHRFVPDEPETVMVGRSEDLVSDAELPDGVTVRRISEPDDVRRMCAMADEAFGDRSPGMAEALLGRLASGRDDMELWVAEADGRIVSCGRLEPVADSEFAGLWGGATSAAWRSRGIYRVLTSERARSALRRGRTLMNSDCTEYSRPILERAGMVKVTTTTPYEWRRA